MKPFIAVNVGALPQTLLESELFGHEKGAFTGAAERRLGRFELAHSGTLFLDEIGEIPASTQVRLLRVLEEREMMRVGGTQSIRVDVRVVAATNRPLRALVEAGEFRTDLYYRLNVLRVYLPPLRERREDIPILVRRFVSELSAQHDRSFKGISAEAMQMLVDYPWPGNIRELRNLVESMVVLAPGREISAGDIPRQIQEGARGGGRLLPIHIGPLLRGPSGAVGDGAGGLGSLVGGGSGGAGREFEFILRSLVELKVQLEELRRRVEEDRMAQRDWLGEVPTAFQGSGGRILVPGIEVGDTEALANAVTVTPGMRMSEIERLVIEAALRETKGNRRKAADMLGIGERTLYRKLKEYKIPDGEVA
jgi:DNA-binding NtrC family response regulator